jgi:WD40 repeat protein
MSFSGDDKLIIMPDDRTLEVWNLNSQKLVDKVQFSEKFKDARVTAFSPDGRYVAASYEDGTTDLYDSGGKLLVTFKSQAELAPTIAFSSSGRLLATGGFDGKVKIWDTVSRRELLTLKGTPYRVLSIAFSEDETKLAILDAYSYLRVWRAPLNLSVSASRPIVYAKTVH